MINGPDVSTPLWAWFLLGPAIVLGLFVPGHFVFKRLVSPLPWVTAFIGSSLLLFSAVLLLDLSPLRLNLFTLGGFLLLATWIGWSMRPPGPRGFISGEFPYFRATWRQVAGEWWWAVPALMAVGSVVLHAGFAPLSGFDNLFRWNHLALLMHDQGSLAHYPAVSAIDFRLYPWCDGIPPLIPVVNLWIYLGTGSTSGSLIIGRLLVELGLTLGLVWHLAKHLWGSAGARVALLALSSSTLFWWSIGIQQETGMAGIAFLVLAALLMEYQKSPSTATAVWVGLAAVFGALCRDYYLILIPVAWVGLALLKAPRRHLLFALGAAVLVGSPWYVRNGWLTGNPLFPHDLGGWLPTNDVHRDYMAAVRSIFTYANPILWHAVLNGLLVGAGVLGLLSLPGMLSKNTGARIIAVLALVSLALCLIAIPSTAGGATYALRVMGPGLPLLAVAAGRIGIGRSPRALVLIGLGLLPLSVDAARRSWNFVWHPHDSPWPYTWTRWVKTQADLQAWRQHPIWPQLVVAAEGESIIVQQPDHHIALTRLGGNPVPLFSPEADVLTAAGPIAFDDAVNVLRQRRVRFVVLSDDQMQNTLLLRSYPVTARLLSMTPSVTIDQLRFYNLELIAQDLAQTAALPESNP